MIKELARLILLTQELREGSFDHEKADKMMEENCFPEYEKCYKLTLDEAAIEATKQLNTDEKLAFPIYLLNKYCWSDAQWWAEKNS